MTEPTPGRVHSPPQPDDVVIGHDPEVGWNTIRGGMEWVKP